MATVHTDKTREELRNEDPITGEPGAHPVGAGLGAAAGGAVAGAAAGAVGGPIGAAVGAVVGGVAGGLGGKAIAENMDPTVELAYWKDNYKTRPYYDSSIPADEYDSAYRMGLSSYRKDCRFEDCEPELRQRWETEHPNSKLTWEGAKQAMSDAWHRLTGSCCNNEKQCRS